MKFKIFKSFLEIRNLESRTIGSAEHLYINTAIIVPQPEHKSFKKYSKKPITLSRVEFLHNTYVYCFKGIPNV